MQAFAQRIRDWLLKAEREAKLHTHWTAQDQDYETACNTLVDDMLLSDEYVSVRRDLRAAARKLDVAGALNGLVAATLHFTAPGIPDLYQGTEYWDQSLVDPDNRRAVDYRARKETLDQVPDFRLLLHRYRDGVIKQQLIYRLMQLRKAWTDLFTKGSYDAVPVAGPMQAHVLAFVRRHGNQQLFVAVPRLCAKHMQDAHLPLIDPYVWTDTHIDVFGGDSACTFVDVFTYRKHDLKSDGWRVDELFDELPFAVLIPSSQADECLIFPG
jgi:(1->4)-alpha-D-glucan 1-alpha-D-glucosylmutase